MSDTVAFIVCQYTKCIRTLHPLYVHQWIDVLCKRWGVWEEAQVRGICNGNVRVHYKGYAHKEEEDIPLYSPRLAVLHTYTDNFLLEEKGCIAGQCRYAMRHVHKLISFVSDTPPENVCGPPVALWWWDSQQQWASRYFLHTKRVMRVLDTHNNPMREVHIKDIYIARDGRMILVHYVGWPGFDEWINEESYRLHGNMVGEHATD